MSNSTAAIIAFCIPFVIAAIVQFVSLCLVPYVKKKREYRQFLKSIQKLPYNKGERVLNKEEQDALRAVLGACDELCNSDNEIVIEDLQKKIKECYGK